MEKEAEIVEFARESGVFSRYFPSGSQYIGDDVKKFKDVTFHELMFLDKLGYVHTFHFQVDNTCHKIVPDESGYKSWVGGFSPDDLRKKLVMVDKAMSKTKAAQESWTA